MMMMMMMLLVVVIADPGAGMTVDVMTRHGSRRRMLDAMTPVAAGRDMNT